jgi:hypothetical protein
MEKLKYPIGHYEKPGNITSEHLRGYLTVLAGFPDKIKTETEHMSDDRLETPYRPDGWNIRQVVNHCADSHMNALIRVKLALTEDNPVIKPYDEAAFARLQDTLSMEIQPAIFILQGVHQRWVKLLQTFTYNEWRRGYYHPEKNRTIPLDESTGMYAWHCEHHLAHIRALKKRMRWE